MTERDTGQGNAGTTSSTYASFREGSSVADGESRSGAAPASGSPTIDIRQKVSDDLRSAKQAAGDQLSGVSDKAKEAAGEQKNMVAEKLGGVASAMEKVALELEQGDHQDIGRLTRNLGSSMRKFSDDIKGRDLGEIAGMAEDFGRKQPLAFLGVAALAGLAASRFLTASSSRHGEGSTSRSEPMRQTPVGQASAPSGANTTGPQDGEGRFNG